MALDMRLARTVIAGDLCLTANPFPITNEMLTETNRSTGGSGSCVNGWSLGDSGGDLGEYCSKYPTLAGCRGTPGGCRIDSLSAKLHLSEVSAQVVDRRTQVAMARCRFSHGRHRVGIGLEWVGMDY
jgi:hypothetical protein